LTSTIDLSFVVFSETGECIWLDLPLIKEVLGFSRELFPSVAYAYLSIPTYTCGTIGFFLCSVDPVREISFFIRLSSSIIDLRSSFRMLN
jgi:spermidine synthase